MVPNVGDARTAKAGLKRYPGLIEIVQVLHINYVVQYLLSGSTLSAEH